MSADCPDMSDFRLLVQFRMLRVQNWLFEVILYSFGIIFGQKTQEHVKTITKRCLEAKHNIFMKMHSETGM